MTDKNVWDRLSNGNDVSLFEQDYTDIVRVEFSRCRDLIFGGAMSTVKTAYHFNGQQVITIDGDTATDVHYGKAILIQEQFWSTTRSATPTRSCWWTAPGSSVAASSTSSSPRPGRSDVPTLSRLRLLKDGRLR